MHVPRLPARWPGRSPLRAPHRRHRRSVTALGVVAVTGLLAVSGASAASAASSPAPVTVASWQQAIKALSVPPQGCFAATYPRVTWRRTTCAAAPRYPYLPASQHTGPPAHHPLGQYVGDGVDYSAEVSGSPLSSVAGSFDSITAGTTETGEQYGTPPQVPNTFSLQLNTKGFVTPACAGSGTPASCRGWQQFLYSTTYNEVFMQYWLLNYNAACPSGWAAYGTDCYTNSSASTLTSGALTVAALPSTTMKGSATGGGTDSVVLTTGAGTATAVGSDSVLDLGASGNWTGIEFAIVGDCCGTEANFSPGTSLAVRTTTHNGTTLAPTCVFEGFTGETNNLNLAPTPALTIGASPGLVSEQTYGSTSTPSCATAAGVGDTHLRTFGNLLYDFQSGGDFIEATTGSQFMVQNRQVSGAPTWPDAAVNQAIAAQIGSSDVAVCTSPTRLVVNGSTVSLGSGGQLSLPGGTVSLSGSTYLIQDTSGDSVTATVNTGSPNWINLGVGLGRWPEAVTGLLANAGTGVTSIAERGGTVLTAPFDFKQFYGDYSSSWRISGTQQDLLTACGSAPPSTDPSNVFYTGNLAVKTAQAAQAVCEADGVTAPALLDPCTVDEAVLGQGAPGVYATVPASVTIGKINPPANSRATRH